MESVESATKNVNLLLNCNQKMTKTSPCVGIVPHQLRKAKSLGELNISELVWHNKPSATSGKVKDLTASDHIVIYPSSKIWFANYNKLKCKVSLLIAEPKVIHHRYYAMLWLLRIKYQNIFVRYKDLTNRYDNVIILPIVGCWIPELSDCDFSNKENRVSLIASNKNQWTGHQLRHQIIREMSNTDINIRVDIMGRGYQPFEHKKEGLLPYQFSIVIENCQENDYFTEKLVDCFVCKTIPIYWGASNIGEYFNVKGMFIFQTLEQLWLILRNLTGETYQEMNPTIEQNHDIARSLSNTGKIIADEL